MVLQFFSSKRVWAAIIGLVLISLEELSFPGVEELDPTWILTIVGFVIGGFSLRDPGQPPVGTRLPE